MLLEQISAPQLRATRNRGLELRTYHSRYFFELEAQRAQYKDDITAALQSVRGISVPVDGWCRSIKLRYAHALLSGVGSLRQGGRFNYGADIDPARFPPFPALYIAADRATAHCEMFGQTQEWSAAGGLSALDLALQRETSVVWLSLAGEMTNIFDLTRLENLKPFLKVTAAFRLTSDFRALERRLRLRPMQVARTPTMLMKTFMDPSWRAFKQILDLPANSQVFGQLVATAGFEGIRYESARTSGAALAIFPRGFRNSISTVRVVDPQPGALCVELNAETYLDAEREEWP